MVSTFPQRNMVRRIIAGLATAAALSLITIAAQAGTVSKQRAQSAADFSMPSGDFVTSADLAGAKALRLTPRLSPTPAGELARIKKMAGAAAESAAVDADSSSAQEAARALFKECVTNAANGFAPSDIHGAVATTNLAVVTNVTVGIFNKTTCALVSSVSLKTFFSQNGGFVIPASETLFDPRVLYDRLSGRCIITAESSNSGNTDQFLYIASSRTSSCTTWRRIRFVLSRVSTGTVFCKAAASDFYDYPNAGYNSRRLVITSNNFPAGSAYGTLLSIDKAALHGTATVFSLCFRSALPTNMAPAVVGDTSTAMFVLSPGSGSGSSVNRRRLNPVGSGSTMADTLTNTGNVAIPAWTAPPNAAQPNGELLDTLDGRFQSASKQIGSVIWNTHSENIGGFARVRTYMISTTGGLLASRTTTTGTCANVDHTFNPSVDTNSTVAGTLAFITYSRTCPSQAAGRAAHLISRGPNTLGAGFVFTTVETSATQFTGCGSACRWGDYSATQIDPTDTGRAWGFNQLVTGTSQFNWNTRAGKVGP
jgi:hypothetical protein